MKNIFETLRLLKEGKIKEAQDEAKDSTALDKQRIEPVNIKI